MWYGAMELEPQFDASADDLECEILEFNRGRDCNRESLSENFHDEMDAWFRRAMASNAVGGI